MSTGINIKKKLGVKEEGTPITTDTSNINFVGAGVTASAVGEEVTVNVPGSIGATAYYLNESVTESPYKEFSSLPTSTTEQDTPTTISVGATSVIGAYQTPAGTPNTTTIPAGLWQFFLHFYSGAIDSWDVYVEVYKRDISAVESLIFTTDVGSITTTSITQMYLLDGVFPNTSLLTTDRIVVKVVATNTGTGSQTIHMITEGSAHYSVGTTTLNQVIPTGAVTSVTGSAPIVSSGGTTPAISIPAATGSVDGYLSSIDWSTFNGKQNAITLTTTGTSGAATLVGSTLNIPNYATSSSGVVGIRNSSGVYTYYATLNAAITAATSGQTVDLLTDITETGSVTVTTKTGVKINGNGYTYTLSVNDDTSAITYGAGIGEMFNIRVVRTGRAINLGGRVFWKNDTTALATLRCQNVIFENTYGIAVAANNTIIDGIRIISYGAGVYAPYDSTGVYNCIITSSAGYGIDLANSSYDIVNCNVTGSTFGINGGFGAVYNSIGKTTSGSGIQSGKVYNSTGISSSGNGVWTGNGNNCAGISTSGAGLAGTFRNSTGISTSGYGGNGTFYTCSLYSSSSYALQSGGAVYLYNSYAESTSSPVTARANIYNSVVRCLWNNAGGSCTNSFVVGSHEVVSSFLEVSNTAAYCITGYVGSTWKYTNNIYKGATTPVNTTNISQALPNTQDNQGNILLW